MCALIAARPLEPHGGAGRVIGKFHHSILGHHVEECFSVRGEAVTQGGSEQACKIGHHVWTCRRVHWITPAGRNDCVPSKYRAIWMTRNRSDEITVVKPRRAPSGAAIMQPTVTLALTRALFEEWAEHGYVGISLERVAGRAGVGKAALYRRWPSKLAMVSDRLADVGIELALLVDTGTLEGDIKALLYQLRRILRHRLVRRILPDLHAEMQRNPDLAGDVRGRLQTERRRRSATILERAVARGELPADVNVDLFNDTIGGLLYWRVIITREKANRAYLDTLMRFIMAGLQGAEGPEL